VSGEAGGVQIAHRQLRYGDEARTALQAGVDAVADAVRVTLGPRGRNVLLRVPRNEAARDPGGLTVTSDGFTIARRIELADPFANQGAEFMREVAVATNDDAGDGTTTAILLAQAILRQGLTNVAAGASAVGLRRGIEHAVEQAVTELRGQSIELATGEQLRRVATVAAADEEIGEAVASAFEAVGSDGVVDVQGGRTMGIELELAEGMQWDRGYISPYMITHADRLEAVLEEPYVLLVDRRLSSAHELLPIVEQVKQAGKPLLVVARFVEGEALAMLLVNKLQGKLTSAASTPPDFAGRRRQIMDDMAVLTGGVTVSEHVGLALEDLELSQLGRARRVVVDRHRSTIIGGLGDGREIKGRMAALRREIEETDLGFYDRKLKERLARLAGVIGLVKVGAPTDSEITERKLRTEDAVQATRAALDEGVVPGGGVALLNAQAAIRPDGLDRDAAAGVEVVRRALEEPLRQIAANAGLDGATAVERARSLGPRDGLDAGTGRYRDLIDAGVLDPTKVTRSALENAASMAKTILSTEAIVVEA
jgi:chaperonin GroEL